MPPLGKLGKVVRGSESRITLFHTERGQLMPPAAWLRLPAAVWRRLAARDVEEPWVVPAAADFLQAVLDRGWGVLEVGAGASTGWYAARTGGVTSLEHSERWREHARTRLERAGLDNAELRLVAIPDFPAAITAEPDASFHVVVVDGDEVRPGDRLACVEAARSKVRPGGYLVLDDSDRPAYRNADDLLRGWRLRRFVGVRRFPLQASETSIYRRPA